MHYTLTRADVAAAICEWTAKHQQADVSNATVTIHTHDGVVTHATVEPRGKSTSSPEDNEPA